MPGETPQEEWYRKTMTYVTMINDFVDRGLRDGWEHAGEQPTDPGREHLAEAAINAVRRANIDGQTTGMREFWPPAHSPLVPMLEENGQSIPVVCLLPDDTIVARIGAPYEGGRTVHIKGQRVTELPEVGFFGRGPNRRFFALAAADGVRVVDGWQGLQAALCPWPTGLEGAPADYNVKPLAQPPTPTRLIPFPDGQRVLLVSSEGIFVLSPARAERLLPTSKALEEHFAWLQEEYPDDDLRMELSMEHGAVSHNGKIIAAGSQCSPHLIFDDQLNEIGDIGNQSEYPHYALFSADDEMIAFNSCHFYNGITIGVPTCLLPNLKTEAYDAGERLTFLEEGARVYAGISRNDEFIIGDAHGYVRGFSAEGEPRWQFFIGSTIGDIDISADGKRLAVSTYAGFISLIDLDVGEQASYQIGNSPHRESGRWLFWKTEERPLYW